jgi:uncharacterized ferredoxin-like protein
VEGVLIRDHAAIVHLNVNEVGVDAVDCGAEGFEKHSESRTEFNRAN